MQLNLIQGSTTIVNGQVTPIGDLAIIQGATFLLSLRKSGNYSLYTPRAQIRDNYLSEGGALFAEFSFLPLTYDGVEDKTSISLTLTDEQTSALPITRYQGDGTLSVRTALVYDVELESPAGDMVKVLEASFVQVKPEVTGGA